MMSISSWVILSKLSNLRASVKKVRDGARIYIKVAGSQSLKVCVGARVYIEGARVYIKNQKYGIAQVQVSDLPDLPELHLSFTWPGPEPELDNNFGSYLIRG